MAKSIFEYNPIFKEAMERVVFRLEAASKEHINIFGQPWYKKHFTMGSVPHTEKDFKTILGQLHLPVAASTINDRAAEPLRMNQGFEDLKQTMFTHAHAYELDTDKILELMKLADLAEKNSDISAVDYIANYLMDQTGAAVDGVDARLDIIILGALSNKGKFTFSAENDPGSPFIGQTIDFGMKTSHCAEVGSGHEWVQEHLESVDPIVELEEVLSRQRRKINTILTDADTVRFIRRTKAMKNYINSTQYPNQPVSLGALNSWMKDNQYPTFEIVEREVGIQRNGKIDTFVPFKAGQMVFLPENQIGTIETCLTPAQRGLKSEGVEYSYYGRTEVRRLTQGEKENSDYREITKATLIAAPSMNTIDQILTLDTTK